jgi:hypothetical protein
MPNFAVLKYFGAPFISVKRVGVDAIPRKLVIINSLTKSGIIQFVSIKDEIKLW